jgi:hypothetical protein
MSWLSSHLGIQNGKIQVSAGPSRRVKEETEAGAQQALQQAKAEALRMGLNDEDAIAIGNSAYHEYRNKQKSWIEKSATRDFAAGGKTTGAVMGTIGGVVAVFPGIGTVIGAVTIAAGAAVSAGGMYAEAVERDRKKMEAAKVQFDKYKAELMLNPTLAQNSGIKNVLQPGNTEFSKAEKELENLRRKQLDIMLCIEREGQVTDRQKEELNRIQAQIDAILERLKINYPEASVSGVTSPGVIKNPEPEAITQQNPQASQDFYPNEGNAINANPETPKIGLMEKLIAFFSNAFKGKQK